MIKDGITGAESCVEIVSPHFNDYAFAQNSVAGLEQVSLQETSVDEMREALAFFYRVFDRAGPQLAFSDAPEDVQDVVLALRDSVKAKISAQGTDPEYCNSRRP